MRFLIDNALSPRVAADLRTAGHDAVHVGSLGLSRTEDEAVFQAARESDRILVSADTDFGTILALGRTVTPSVIVFRHGAEYHPKIQSRRILEELPALAEDLEQGSVVVIEPARVRVRRLRSRPPSRGRAPGSEG